MRTERLAAPTDLPQQNKTVYGPPPVQGILGCQCHSEIHVDHLYPDPMDPRIHLLRFGMTGSDPGAYINSLLPHRASGSVCGYIGYIYYSYWGAMV